MSRPKKLITPMPLPAERRTGPRRSIYTETVRQFLDSPYPSVVVNINRNPSSVFTGLKKAVERLEAKGVGVTNRGGEVYLFQRKVR